MAREVTTGIDVGARSGAGKSVARPRCSVPVCRLGKGWFRGVFEYCVEM